jgi:hypothetical protein
MDGQRSGLDGRFVSPFNGMSTDMPPMHPQCRCAIGLVAKANVRPIPAVAA